MPSELFAKPGDHQVVIVGHYARRHQAWKLFEEVNATRMFMDDGHLGAGENHLNAWHWLSKNNLRNWSVVLEDDALPVPNFREQLQMALAQASKDAVVVSLYLGRSRPPQWQDSIARVIAHPADPCWFFARDLLHHVGVAIRTHELPVMVHGVHQVLRHYPIDEAIGRWAGTQTMNEVPIAYTNPSLVDHRWDQPSVITERMHDGHVDATDRPIDPKAPRKAWRVGGRTNWTDSVMVIPTP